MLRLLLMTLVVVSTVATASAASIGQARIAKFAPSAFDKYTRSPKRGGAALDARSLRRMLVFSPYWDSRLPWYSNGWAYKDLYGVPTGSAFANAHPDWILRDGAGRALYLRFACSGGTCPQLAGDIGNPAFRSDGSRRPARYSRKGTSACSSTTSTCGSIACRTATVRRSPRAIRARARP
jgi:hypothetical protein